MFTNESNQLSQPLLQISIGKKDLDEDSHSSSNLMQTLLVLRESFAFVDRKRTKHKEKHFLHFIKLTSFVLFSGM